MKPPTLPLTAELVLLILDDDTGKALVDSTKRKAAVAGSTVLELVLDGVLELTPGEARHARLVATPGAPEPHSVVLAQARDRVIGHKPKDAVARLGGASDWKGRADEIRDAVLQDLAGAGIVEPVEHTTLGVVRSTRWVLRRPEVEAAIRGRIADVLGGGQPDTHTAALVGLANAIDLLPKLFPGRDKKVMRRRATEIVELAWGGQAVSQVVQEVEGAVIAAVVTTTVSASS
jgi:hypothetical protein